jgi:hypothetical protein
MKKLILLLFFIGCNTPTEPSKPTSGLTFCTITNTTCNGIRDGWIYYSVTIENIGDYPAINVMIQTVRPDKSVFQKFKYGNLNKYQKITKSFAMPIDETAKLVWDNM